MMNTWQHLTVGPAEGRCRCMLTAQNDAVPSKGDESVMQAPVLTKMHLFSDSMDTGGVLLSRWCCVHLCVYIHFVCAEFLLWKFK